MAEAMLPAPKRSGTVSVVQQDGRLVCEETPADHEGHHQRPATTKKEQEQETRQNRTPKQIRIDNLHLEDENRKLTLRVNKIEQELEETRERDDRHWQLAKERQEQVATLREELMRVQGEAAALREQADALQRGDTVIHPTSPEMPVVPPEEPDPVVVPEEPVETKPVVLTDVVLTDDQRGASTHALD